MVIAGILAGGTGSRMGQYNVPKQFLSIKEKPLILHTIEKFLIMPQIDQIIVAVHSDWLQFMNDILRKYSLPIDKITLTNGGNSRNDSISQIITTAKELGAQADDILLTHDAVRPFISYRIINENVDAAREFGICDTVIPATDTIVEAQNNNFITSIPNRNNMYQGQTPQSFRIGLYEEMIAKLAKEELEFATDICKLFISCGYKVRLVNGDVTNMKITYPFDYKMAQIMMEDILVD